MNARCSTRWRCGCASSSSPSSDSVGASSSVFRRWSIATNFAMPWTYLRASASVVGSVAFDMRSIVSW